jgi:RNA polymerase sigma-70 factor, ECF subfamily
LTKLLALPDRSFVNLQPARDQEFNEGEFKKFFEELFRNNFKPLCYYCQHKFGLDFESSKDIVHNGFTKLWESRHALQGHDTLKAYIYKIIANSCLNNLSHNTVKRRHEKYILEHSVFHLAENPDVNLLLTDLDKTIAELPEQMRTIFQYSRQSGLKYQEIACLMNISQKTVETQMSRALAKLRKKLNPSI